MSKRVYEASLIKRQRRTKADMHKIKDGLFSILEHDHPQTVRGAFYQATVMGLVPKIEAAYATVGRLLGDMRKAGVLPWEYIADATRWMRKPASYDDVNEILNVAARSYRKAIWNDQATYVEVWCEKEALAGVIYEVTEEWDVPLMITRGYPSLSFIHSAAAAIETQGRPCFIYYLGDHDPSGVDIPRHVEQSLREFAPAATIFFTRLAVTVDQIRVWNLPSRPTKKTDTRARGFVGDSVELDAIPARMLKQLVREAIENHIDADALERTRAIEAAEKKSLIDFRERWAA